MYLGVYNLAEVYNHNRMFSDPSSPNGENLAYPWVLAAQLLRERGHRYATLDMEADLDKFDAVIFLENPTLSNPYLKRLVDARHGNLNLFVYESKITYPPNYDFDGHKYFRRVFTYNDGWLDGQKYLKLNYSFRIEKQYNFNPAEKEKLCVMVSGNHTYYSHPLELYSERVKAVRWFEANHPDDFDLFGFGWQYPFRGYWGRRLNRFKSLWRFGPPYASYRGPVRSKNEVMKKYKFAICYENCRDVPGYITEKIFDCFFAGCVPVYWGAPNITDHIPARTFIDKRNFKGYEDVFKYIKNMSESEYLGYLTEIKTFLEGKRSYPFSAEYFADLIVNRVLEAK